MMKRYTSVPVTIEATQITDNAFDGDHPNEEHVTGVIYDPRLRRVFIDTLEGRMSAGIGDWIIRGTEGELYPCKDVVFSRKYRPADEPFDRRASRITGED